MQFYTLDYGRRQLQALVRQHVAISLGPFRENSLVVFRSVLVSDQHIRHVIKALPGITGRRQNVDARLVLAPMVKTRYLKIISEQAEDVKISALSCFLGIAARVSGLKTVRKAIHERVPLRRAPRRRRGTR